MAVVAETPPGSLWDRPRCSVLRGVAIHRRFRRDGLAQIAIHQAPLPSASLAGRCRILAARPRTDDPEALVTAKIEPNSIAPLR
jgi:hypothetical protein